MTAPAKSAPVSDSVKEGVFRFLKDFREGYEATSFGIYYQAFNLLADARCMEDAGHIAEVRFHRDPTNRIDGLELVRLTPKPPKLRIEDEGNGSIEGGVDTRGGHRLKMGNSTPLASNEAPSDLDSQPAPSDFVNGCDFCGHTECPGCCWKCSDPECCFNKDVCPVCVKYHTGSAA